MKYASAILLCLLLTPLTAQEKPKPEPIYNPSNGEPGARRPDISNDGKLVVFSLWGDIWRWDAEGGAATQLTLHEACDSFPKLSPDGGRIAFSSDRDGNYNLYLMDVRGGVPRQLTWHSAHDYVAGFSGDGEWLYFTSTRIDKHALWRVPAAGGTEELVLEDNFEAGDVSIRDGDVAYCSGAVNRYRRGYKGSANEEIYLLREGYELPGRLTEFEGNDRNAALLPDGRLLFTRELERHFQFMVLDGPGEEPRQLSNFTDVGADEVSVSAGGEWLVFQRMHYLYRARTDALLTGEAGGELIKLTIDQDPRGPQTEERTFTSGMENPHLADNGKLLAFELRGAIWVCNPDGGEARRVTEPGKGDSRPRLSPDGRLIAFQSRRSGNSDLWIVSVNGGEPSRVTTDPKDDFFHNWSPDGSALVFCSERSGNRDVWLKRIDGSPAVQLTTSPESDDDPSFSPDGKLIAFDSARRGTADIWLMDADGRNQRFVTGGPDVEQSPVFSRDGSILYYERYASGESTTSIYVTTPAGGGAVLLAGAANSPSETLDGARVVFASGGKLKTLPAPRQVLDARDLPVVAHETVDLAAERVQLFNEAWDMINTRFYTADFHGADWPAIKDKYLPLVERCRTIEECYYYIWMAIGELSASHLGVGGRASGSGKVATAELGALLKPVVMNDGRQAMRVDRLENGGPLDQVWVRKGDYIVALGGRQFGKDENVWARFDLWKSGYGLKLWVSPDGSLNLAREVVVRAETAQQAGARRYQAKITERSAKVSELSGGRVLYIHLTAMNDSNLQKFQNLLATPEAEKAEGLIIDSRWNSGGLSYMQIMDLLMAKPYLQIKPRTRPEWKQPRLYWDKPVTVMCNEYSNSGGECFPWAIKTTGRGKVVGERTPGNVIGTAWDRLADGSYFGVPTEGYFSMDGKRNLENDGVRPDVRVEVSARDRVTDADPQLEEAVRVILSELPVRQESGK
ncbi:MAG: PD40 domain-containing protein [Planctomycetes bacterium]|nr:PD40 domain-containing protein [Planctomycetota bacterium]MCB9936215.1 PD40 domain-containing protein [Planctomycetota bacterium]